MPQLDTIYTTLIYMWTWSMMYMITKKIKTFMMTNPQKHTTKPMKTQSMPWL